MIKGTTAEAGIKKDEVYTLVIKFAIENNGEIQTTDVYDIINSEMAKKGFELSEQGKASLRRTINTNAIKDGLIYPFDINSPGWKITPEARELFIDTNIVTQEIIFNQDTQVEEVFLPNVVRGALFEKYCLDLLKVIYPFYSWFHQGIQKNNERGLDLIAEKIGEVNSEYRSLGVQIKNHQENSSPTEKEWLKFMAGCFVRHIDKAVFITTGRLSSEQRREAGEAKILIIEGIDELHRIAKKYGQPNYEE